MDWVRGGGNLLVIVDHPPSSDTAQLLCKALGVETRSATTWDIAATRPAGYNYPAKDFRQASNILFSRERGSLGTHPIIDGRTAEERVNRVATYVGSSLLGPVDSTALLRLSPEALDYWKEPPERGGAEHRISAAGRSQGVAFGLGAGRVVVVSEFTAFMARSMPSNNSRGSIGAGLAYPDADNQQFVLNIVRWLARVIP